MIKTTDILRYEFCQFSNPDAKIKRCINNNELYPIVRGLYETNSSTPGYYLAQIICHPSYLSFEYALSFYDLIPEKVYTYTNAVLNKNKTKEYSNVFGNYIYYDIPKSAFSKGINYKKEDQYSFLIASPEKAICDILYKTSPLKNQKNLSDFLFENLRTEPNDFFELDKKELLDICSSYQTSNHKIMKSFINRYFK